VAGAFFAAFVAVGAFFAAGVFFAGAAFVAGAAFFAAGVFFAGAAFAAGVAAFFPGLREMTFFAAAAAEPANDFVVLRTMGPVLLRARTCDISHG
jgi:hypothetical protein